MNNAVEQDASSDLNSAQIAEDSSLIGGYAYQIIRKQAKQVFKLRSPVIADTNPENLHQMRIGTRRLRSALLLFADTVEIKGTAPIELSKSVAKLTKSLGKVRDIDVMEQWLVQMLDAPEGSISIQEEGENASAIASTDSPFSKKEKKVIQSLLKALRKRRKKQFAQMESTLGSSPYKKLVKQCKRWIKQPKFSPVAQQTAASSAIRKMVEPLAELLQHPSWEIATKAAAKSTAKNSSSEAKSQRRIIKRISLDQLNQQLDQHGDQLHDLRKQIKSIRYQTEFFRGLYGIHYAAQIRE
ncbi:MAG: CHAD domain-containing protein, partial [Phormidesmis sp.]